MPSAEVNRAHTVADHLVSLLDGLRVHHNTEDDRVRHMLPLDLGPATTVRSGEARRSRCIGDPSLDAGEAQRPGPHEIGGGARRQGRIRPVS